MWLSWSLFFDSYIMIIFWCSCSCADVRDGDFQGRGGAQSEGTHGERGGGSGGPDQLNKQHLHTGLLHSVFVTRAHRDNGAELNSAVKLLRSNCYRKSIFLFKNKSWPASFLFLWLVILILVLHSLERFLKWGKKVLFTKSSYNTCSFTTIEEKKKGNARHPVHTVIKGWFIQNDIPLL